jgi:hypothetical protein
MERKAWLKKIHDKGGLPPFLAMQYSLTVSDANLLISRLEQQDILFPQTEMSIMDLQGNKQLDPSEYPYAHLALQLATVRSRKNRLLKPTNGDDDLFRAWANAAVKAFTDDLVVQMLGAHGTKQDKPAVNQSRGYAVRASGHGGGLRRGAGETSGTATTSSVGTMAAIRRTGKMRG